jgi:hypothetical protein
MINVVAILCGLLVVLGLVLGVVELQILGGAIAVCLTIYLLTANAVVKRFTGEYANDHELELLSRDLLKRAIRKK